MNVKNEIKLKKYQKVSIKIKTSIEFVLIMFSYHKTLFHSPGNSNLNELGAVQWEYQNGNGIIPLNSLSYEIRII